MIRIAYICADPGVPVFGMKGCSVHVQEGLRALRAEGAAVTLFATRLGGTPPPDLADVPVRRLPRAARSAPAAREQAALAANATLAAHLDAGGPFDLVYERYALWSRAGMAYARRTGTPGLLEVNAPLIEEQATHRGLVNRFEAEAVAHDVFGHATALLAVSRAVGDYLQGFPGARGRIHVVPNGVNTARFRPGLRAAYPAPAGAFTVGFVGTLKPWHGLPDLVAAFEGLHRRHPNTRLLIVGDGPERERLAADLAARDLSAAAHLTGAVAPEAVPGLLASMDVAVAPYPPLASCYFSPLKVYEYMAAGVPVVASCIGQLATVLHHGEDALLYAPGDVAALTDVLAQLHRDPALRKRLRVQARARVLQHHTWQAVAQQVLAFAGLRPSIRTAPLEAAG